LKRPPNRKLVLAAAVLIVAASSLFARSVAGPADLIQPVNTHFILGGR